MNLQVVIAIICVVISTCMLFYVDQPSERYYDCRLAEFHPDYPEEVKQACRQMIINSRKTYI